MGKDAGPPTPLSPRGPTCKVGQLRSTEDLARIAGSGIVLRDFILAAAGGTRIPIGSPCWIKFHSDKVMIDGSAIREYVPYNSILALQVSGSTVRSNLGVLGGGFGVVGATEGMLAAAVINTLTTRTRQYAVLRLTTGSSEYVFSSDARDGSALGLTLTPVQVEIRQAQQANQAGTAPPPSESSVGDELRKLAHLRDEGVLTDEEFAGGEGQIARQVNRPASMTSTPRWVLGSLRSGHLCQVRAPFPTVTFREMVVYLACPGLTDTFAEPSTQRRAGIRSLPY